MLDALLCLQLGVDFGGRGSWIPNVVSQTRTDGASKVSHLQLQPGQKASLELLHRDCEAHGSEGCEFEQIRTVETREIANGGRTWTAGAAQARSDQNGSALRGARRHPWCQI